MMARTRVVAMVALTAVVAGSMLVAPSAAGAAGKNDDSKKVRVVRVKPKKLPRSFANVFNGRLEPSGVPSKALALDAFTTAFGPLPGTHATKLPTTGVVEGTQASSALLAHWNELTDAQREAASRLLVGPDGSFITDSKVVDRGSAPTATPSIGRSAHAVPRVARTPDEYAVLVDQARAAIESRLGITLNLPLRVRVAELTEPGSWFGEEMGYVGTAPSPPGVLPEGCLLTFTRAAASRGNASQRSTVAHEVFHCFQDQISVGTSASMPQWTVEGQAEWVGETIAGGSSSSASAWDAWLLQPWLGLFRRSYDAIGFYSVLDARGRDPWAFMPAMLQVRSSEEQFTAAAGADAALVDVATAETRLPAFGAQWESTGPGITRAQARATVTVSPGSPVEIRQDLQARGTQGYDVTVRGDIVSLDADTDLGAVAFTGGSTARMTSGLRGSWCVHDGGCTCPDGTTPSANGRPVAPGGRGPIALAAASVPARPGFAVHLAAVSLTTACADATSSSGTGRPACLTGSFHLTDQRLVAPLASALGDLTISGGIGGRRIEFRDDGTYTVTDDGSDPVTVSADVGGVTTTSTANVVATGTGRFAPRDDGSVDFTSESLSGTVTLSTDVAGQHIESSQPLDASGLGGVYGFNGPATYDCSGNRLSLEFQNVTFVLERD